MAEVRDQPIKLLTMGDELLLGIMELLCMADVLSCSLVGGATVNGQGSNMF